MVKEFTTAKRERGVIPFRLDNDDYHFTPTKVAAVLMPVLEHDDPESDGAGLTMTQRVWEWLREGLPHEVRADAVEERAADDDRPLTFATRGEALALWSDDEVYCPEYDRIRGRLNDPADDLDVPNVAEVVRWLMSKVSGRPTSSRSG